MKMLYVLFDESCGLCLRLKEWLEAQPALVELRLLPAGGDEASQVFPGLYSAGQELVVISDEGDVYRGNQGWIMCLWALAEYRELAYRLSTPVLLPLARAAFSALSRHRRELSAWLKYETSEPAIAATLIRLPADSCSTSPRQAVGEKGP